MDLSRRVVLAGLAATVSGAAAAAFLAEPGAASASAAGREPAAATPRSEGWFAPGTLPARTCVAVSGLAVGALVEVDLLVARA